MNRSLLKLQIGPVQDFIAQARSTRDLWSGSYLLSWLMAHALRVVTDGPGSEAVIFPAVAGQPLLQCLDGTISQAQVPAAALTPNMPNVCVVQLNASEAEAVKLAQQMEAAIRGELKRIADECWKRIGPTLETDGKSLNFLKDRFDHQIKRFLSVSWQVVPSAGDYAKASSECGRLLGAVRRTHAFSGWSSGRWITGALSEKDALTGREEAICGGRAWRQAAIRTNPNWDKLFPERQSSECYAAMTLVKRLWPRVCPPGNLDVHKLRPVPTTWQVARGSIDADESRCLEKEDGHVPGQNAYFAVLAMDGDEMGEWIRGQKEIRCDPQVHADFSSKLSQFALNHAGSVVRAHTGHLIYAGGDDVLALLPSYTALDCAKALRDRFRETLGYSTIEASVGIAIAHCKDPLQDVVRAAQAAEGRAKRNFGRGAVAVSLFKRSSGAIEWGGKWESGGLDFHDAFAQALRAGELTSKAPHRLIELLTPYLSLPSPLIEERASANSDKSLDDADFARAFDEIVSREFDTVLDRQRASRGPTFEQLRHRLKPHLDKYLRGLPAPSVTEKLHSLIGVCELVAFGNKLSSEERQPS